MSELEEVGKIWDIDPSDIKEVEEQYPDGFRKDISNTTIAKVLQSQDGTVQSASQKVEKRTAYDTFDLVEPPFNPDHLAKLYETSEIHAAAVDAKIDNIVGLGFYFDYTRKAEKIRQKAAKKEDDKRDALEEKLTDAKHELGSIADDFNQEDEFDETLEKFLKDRFTVGNGFLEIGRNNEGVIKYVGHVPASTVRVRRNRDGFVQYVNGDPIFFRNFGDRETADPFGSGVTPNEIIHYKKYSPTNDYYGVPEVVSVLKQIAGVEFATDYNIDYFENKAVPRYMIVLKGATIGKANQQQLMGFLEGVRGRRNSHRSIVIPLPSLNSEITFEPIESGKQESSFGPFIKENNSLILQRHRVPQNRLGASDGTSLAASRDADKIFKESVCRPEQRIIEKKVDKIFKEFTDMFTFKLNEYSLTDEDQQSQIYERYVRNGIMVPDEARVKLGFQARPDGDGDLPVDTRAIQKDAQEAAAALAKENLKAQAKTQSDALTAQKSETKAQTGQTRTRDADRSASRPDQAGSPNGRQTQGSGRKVG